MAATNKQVIYDLIVKTQGTTDLQRLEAELTKFTQQTERAKGAANNFKAPVESMQKSFGGLKSAMGNVGFQLQDFAVQVAAGTSPARSLAQQLPQLLSGFGGLGIVVGTAAAVLIPLASALIGTGKSMQGLDQTMENLKTKTSDLVEFQKLLAEQAEKTSVAFQRYGERLTQINADTLIAKNLAVRQEILKTDEAIFTELTKGQSLFFELGRAANGWATGYLGAASKVSDKTMEMLGGFEKMERMGYRAFAPLTEQARIYEGILEAVAAKGGDVQKTADALAKMADAKNRGDAVAYAQAVSGLVQQIEQLMRAAGASQAEINAMVGSLKGLESQALQSAAAVGDLKAKLLDLISLRGQMTSFGLSLNGFASGGDMDLAIRKYTDLSGKIKETQFEARAMWTAMDSGGAQKAKKALEDVLTPTQRLNDKITELKKNQADLSRYWSPEEAKTYANAISDAEKELAKLNETAAGGGKGGGGGGKKGGGGGAAGAIKKTGDAAKEATGKLKEAADQAKELGDAFKSLLESGANQLMDAMFAIADGSKSAKEAFADMAKSMLKQIAQLVMQLLILKPLMGMFGGGIGGLFGGASPMGMSTRGVASLLSVPKATTIGNYQGYGPSPSAMQTFRSSAIIQSAATANQAAPMNVTINNNSSAAVKTRKESDALYIDIIEDVVSDRITRGGNKIDAAMQRAYSARRVGY